MTIGISKIPVCLAWHSDKKIKEGETVKEIERERGRIKKETERERDRKRERERERERERKSERERKREKEKKLERVIKGEKDRERRGENKRIIKLNAAFVDGNTKPKKPNDLVRSIKKTST